MTQSQTPSEATKSNEGPTEAPEFERQKAEHIKKIVSANTMLEKIFIVESSSKDVLMEFPTMFAAVVTTLAVYLMFGGEWPHILSAQPGLTLSIAIVMAFAFYSLLALAFQQRNRKRTIDILKENLRNALELDPIVKETNIVIFSDKLMHEQPYPPSINQDSGDAR